MILDVLGVFIGFAGVMLLLSLFVTAGVQAIQSSAGLRFKNLRDGLTAALDGIQATLRAGFKSPGVVGSAAEAKPPVQVKPADLVNKLLEGVSDKRRPKSWIEAPQLKQALRVFCDDPAGLDRAVDGIFSDMEKELSRRFAIWARWISLGLAGVVAFLFQVSSPDLVRDLAADPQLRAKYAAAAEGLLPGTEKPTADLPGFKEVAPRALEKLAAKYPDVAPRLKEAKATKASHEGLVAELGASLKDVPDPAKAGILRDYGAFLDEARLKQIDSWFLDAQNRLARLNIQIWGQGTSFYFDGRHVGQSILNWLGVLMTAVLLTLGAPFWFEALRNAAKLRDMFAPKQ